MERERESGTLSRSVEIDVEATEEEEETAAATKRVGSSIRITTSISGVVHYNKNKIV